MPKKKNKPVTTPTALEPINQTVASDLSSVQARPAVRYSNAESKISTASPSSPHSADPSMVINNFAVNAHTFTDKQREENFSKILPSIILLVKNIKMLQTSSQQKLLGAEKANNSISACRRLIGAAFLANKNFKEAYGYLTQALDGGFSNAGQLIFSLHENATTTIAQKEYKLELLPLDEKTHTDFKADYIYLKRQSKQMLQYTFLGPEGVVHTGSLSADQLSLEEFPQSFIIDRYNILLPKIVQKISANYLLKARLRFLDIFRNERYPAEVKRIESDLIQIAQAILQTYILESKSETEIEELFKDHQKYIGVAGFLWVIDAEKDPIKRAKWRIRFFNFLETHKNAIDHIESVDVFISQHAFGLANYYLEEKKYLQCLKLLEKIPKILPENKETCISLPAHFAYQILSTKEVISIDALEQTRTLLEKAALLNIQQWTEEDAQHPENSAIFLYLNACYLPSHKKIFNVKQNIVIVEAALKIKELKSSAHLFYGRFFDEGIGVTQSDSSALQHYKLAADLGEPQALQNLSMMYEQGQGVEPNLEIALKYARKSFAKNDPQANLFLAKLLLKKARKDGSLEDLSEALNRLKITQEILINGCFFPEAVENLGGEVALVRSECLLLLSYPTERHQWNTSRLKYFLPGERNVNSPAILENLKRALHSDDNTSKIAALNLGIMYFYGSHVDKSLNEADKFFQQALDLNEASEGYNAELEAYLMWMRSVIFNVESFEEKDEGNKKILQSKALLYYQKAMEAREDDFPAELTAQFGSFYNREFSTRPKDASSSQSFYESLQQAPKTSTEHLNNLKKMLVEEKPEYSETYFSDLTTCIEGIGEHILEAKDLFPKLQTIVQNFVLNAHRLKDGTLIKIMRNVGKWHLTEASAALEPLFMYIHCRDKNFSEWSETIKVFSQCGFSHTVQSKNIPKFLDPLNKMALPDFKALAKNSPHPHLDTSRFFYSLALLDANQPESLSNEIYYDLALKIFTLLKSEFIDIDQMGLEDVSKLYHAHKYFQLRYPDSDWSINNYLALRFQEYENLLQDDQAVTFSITQKNIHTALQKINPNIKQETFVLKAGRRVDFLLENLVIQYDGTWRHSHYDHSCRIAFPSAKDVLCKKTLQLAGYSVANISRSDWHPVLRDHAAQGELLDRKFPNIPRINKKAPASPSENPNSFLAPPAKGIPPVTLHVGNSSLSTSNGADHKC